MGPTTRVRLHVVPGAKRSGIVGRHGDAWKIRVTAPPERGAANDAVVRLLADALDVPARAVSIVSGHGAREKTVEVAGIDAFTIESALAKEAGR
jgi:uncharacterized protein (TIGR00251 family)